jgi:hypothetical protein
MPTGPRLLDLEEKRKILALIHEQGKLGDGYLRAFALAVRWLA